MTDSCAASGPRAQVPRQPAGVRPGSRRPRRRSRDRSWAQAPSSSPERGAASRAAATSGGAGGAATPRRGRRGAGRRPPTSLPASPPGGAGKRALLPAASACGCPRVSAAEFGGVLGAPSGQLGRTISARPDSHLWPGLWGGRARRGRPVAGSAGSSSPPAPHRSALASVPPAFLSGKGWGEGVGWVCASSRRSCAGSLRSEGRRTPLLSTRARQGGRLRRASRKKRLLS